MNEVHIHHSTCSLSSTLTVVMPIQWNRMVYRHKTSGVILTASEGKSEQKIYTDHNFGKSTKGKEDWWLLWNSYIAEETIISVVFQNAPF